MKLLIKSFGCQMNKLDTALITSALQQAGFHLADDIGDADAVLINTCSVREHAEERVLSHLGHLKHIKKSRPEIIVAVVGCMAQRLGDKLLEHKAVDIVCGPGLIPKMPELLAEVLSGKKKRIAVSEKIRLSPPSKETEALDRFESLYDSDTQQPPCQAFVRVMRGCNKFCSYCVVPYVRGPEVSRPADGIIEQIKKLAAGGIKQVTLLGQTINSYKYVAGEKTYHLADLLEMVSEIEGIRWIRFITSYPAGFDEAILRAMADLPKVCPYLHIPAQSGSDKILRALNRNYTGAEYLALLQKARQIVPGIAIAGDFIVGFPGEAEQDFEASVDLVKKAQYKNCFVFKYSPRPGTITEKKWKDNIPAGVKKERNHKLLAVQEKISDRLSREFMGKTVEVLVEGLSKKPHLDSSQSGDKPQLVGRTAADWIVVFNGPESLAGQFIQVKIIKTSPLTLFGELAT
jgi:tRNA-2-methylthio-N6-dimethylallyladenosine synthase